MNKVTHDPIPDAGSIGKKQINAYGIMQVAENLEFTSSLLVVTQYNRDLHI